ncbi:MAG: twin-arginine translocase TatA/TatE family subunit [Victivallaceae bacterium]|mgnify:CR=1 FL=1|nr:twin-arginine translocase TatA/TatE family subunit [Victivallaceae bacterium]MDD4180040.1 twin-arginine translocase TatA/TatE family subunit [Victivallaceae bacterium]
MTITNLVVPAMLSGGELIAVIVVILILFGASAIPRFARSLGKAKSEFEKGLKEGQESSSKDEDKKDSEQ